MREDDVDIFDWGGLLPRAHETPPQPPIPQRKSQPRPRLNLNGRKTGNILYMTRATHGLTQQELAYKVGVSVKTINAIENQRSTPSVYLSIGIAKALSAKVEDIFILHETWPDRRLGSGSLQS